MTENEDHLQRPCVLTNFANSLRMIRSSPGASIGKCHDQIEVLILVAQEAFPTRPGTFPILMNIGKRFRDHTLRILESVSSFFKNNSCAGVRHERSEDVDVISPSVSIARLEARVSSLSM